MSNTPLKSQSAATQAARPRALLVLGMHRSGTSALTRVTNLLGVALGDDLMPAHETNEKGFWEHASIVGLNDQLLAALGSGWDDARALPEDGWERAELAPIRDHIVERLRADFGAVGLWGLKDPRLCRLLPIWQSLLAELGVEPAYVLIVRNPYEVAASLARRDRMPEDKALLLWLRHVLEAERHTRGQARAFISYDALLGDWRGQVESLGARLGLDWPVPFEQAAAQIGEFLSPELRHHNAGADQVHTQDQLHTWVAEAYAALTAAAGGNDSALATLARIDEELRGQDALVAPGYIPPGVEPPEPGSQYAAWTAKFVLTDSERALLLERVAALAAPPRFQLLLRLPPQAMDGLADAIDDAGAQLYARWKLSVVAPLPAPHPMFDELEVLEWVQAGDDTAAVNALAADSDADWLVLLRPGDRLPAQALARIAEYIALHPDWRYVYVDEDRIDAAGRRCDPKFKPDFNLDLLRSTPYIGGLAVVRRDAYLAAGGLTAGELDSYDLALRVLDACGEAAIGHVPDVLLHRRADAPDDAALRRLEPAGRAAVAAHLARAGVHAEVGEGYLPGTWRVGYKLTRTPRVSIIIPTRDRLDLLAPCVDSLLDKTGYRNYEVLVVDNNSTDPATLAWMEALPAHSGGRARVLRYPHAFNYSAINNFAARAARGEFLLLLNNDTQVIQEQWLERMLAHGLRPEVGVVGARLLFANGSLQHAGVIIGLSGIADHPLIGQPMQAPGYMNRAQVDQNFSAVTAACLLISKALFEEVGGFDEQDLKVLFNDVDLCLKVGERGRKMVWTPYATLIHHGSVSQKAEKPDPKKAARVMHEQITMIERWMPKLVDDPAYNRHLSLSFRNYEIDADFDAPWDRRIHDRPRIMGYPLDRYGCGEYRVHAPLRALMAAGLARSALLPEHKASRMPFSWELARAAPDTLVLQSVLHDKQLGRMRDYQVLNRDVFKVFELDDLKTEVPRKSAHFRHLYQDMDRRLRRALALCDRMLVSTQPIADAYRGWIDDIVVVPNYLERARWSGVASARRNGVRPRVGWAGGASHSGDLGLLHPVLRELADEVDFVFFGMCPEALRPLVREFHPGVPFDQYPARLAGLDLDLALAPLEINRFNEAKSNLRLLEYGILGWPVVCTDAEPYRGAPVTRVANQPRAWIEAVRAHVADRDASATAGQALRQWVLDNWMLEDHLEVWLSALLPKTNS